MLSSGPDNGVSSKSSATASDSLRIPLICLLIGTLHALRPVLKHILSNLDRESLFALENAETYVEDVRRSNMNRCGERIDEVSEGICYDGRDESEFNKEYYENDANRVIRSFDRVIAWHSAVVSIWTQGSRWFSGKDLRVYQFSYDPTGPVDPSSSQLHTILHQIDQDRHWRDSDVQALRGKAMLASVHPEAALMCWASFTASRTLLNAVRMIYFFFHAALVLLIFTSTSPSHFLLE
ncbi:hypothetical protein GYMLUDRAFT_952436 [Collybiopsis luxurians FD-317 M1]|nr:hypothetical protein GYMLUDRAFT_952436 [Collybiopsis luxurians FD-317 M1]